MPQATTQVELDHHCPSCRAVSTAMVIGHGVGGGPYTGGDGQFIAQANAERDAAALIRLARCPACDRRDPAAIRGLWKRAGWVMAGVTAFGASAVPLRDEPFGLDLIWKMLWGPLGAAYLIAGCAVAAVTAAQLRGSRRRVHFLPQPHGEGPYRRAP